MSQPTSSRSNLAEALSGWPPPVLDPHGPFSNTVTTLAWVLFALMAAGLSACGIGVEEEAETLTVIGAVVDLFSDAALHYPASLSAPRAAVAP